MRPTRDEGIGKGGFESMIERTKELRRRRKRRTERLKDRKRAAIAASAKKPTKK